MTTHDRLIADVIAAADNQIVGRIRLQKILYLLDRLGLEAGASFHYHHYGPYSRALDDALDRAKAFHGVTEKFRTRKDGASYSAFEMSPSSKPPPEKIGGLDREKAHRLIAKMKARTSTVLELAATIDWLVQSEKVSDWKNELVRRKGIKTEGGRIDEAVKLLSELDLPPA